MIAKNTYWIFKKALTPQVCQTIKEFSLNKRKEFAVTGNLNRKKLTKENKKQILNIRNSNVVWLNEKWLYNILQPYITAANQQAGWNFHWNNSESVQFTIYKKNQFYDWHTDWGVDHFNRKISMTVQLSKPEDYEGGDLEFDPRDGSNPKADTTFTSPDFKEQGTLVVFPSFIYHRVKPVTKGTRYSLVMWSTGEPFK